MASALVVRGARPGDGDGCARAWIDAGRYYAEIDPELFQVPAEAGLPEWFDQGHRVTRADELRLVAAVDGKVVGFVLATLQGPVSAAGRQLIRGLDRPRVLVGALAVATRYRRCGYASALMTEVERWARESGADVVSLDTNIRSPVSVPFYEDKMGYTRHAIVYRKTLR